MSSLYGGSTAKTDLLWILPDLSMGFFWATGSLICVAGILMTASGAGGGAVFVTILTSLGGLNPQQAIPLSKLLILTSSSAVFLLNTVFKKRTNFIDFNLVYALVPMCLAGTLIGVLTYTVSSDFVLMIVLTILLLLTLLKTSKMAYDKWKKRAGDGTASAASSTPLMPQPPLAEHEIPILSNPDAISRKKNIVLASLIVIVVACGSFSKQSFLPTAAVVMMYIIPICACSAVAVWFKKTSLNPSLADEISYALFGFISGFISGLVGIGGGTLIAPFLLHKGVQPATAVTVSSTVVLFTSASTTFQYIFLGRVSITVGLTLSVFSVGAGIIAVAVVRFIAQKTQRQILVYFLVMLAASTSTALAILQAIQYR